MAMIFFFTFHFPFQPVTSLPCNVSLFMSGYFWLSSKDTILYFQELPDGHQAAPYSDNRTNYDEDGRYLINKRICRQEIYEFERNLRCCIFIKIIVEYCNQTYRNDGTEDSQPKSFQEEWPTDECIRRSYQSHDLNFFSSCYNGNFNRIRNQEHCSK